MKFGFGAESWLRREWLPPEGQSVQKRSAGRLPTDSATICLGALLQCGGFLADLGQNGRIGWRHYGEGLEAELGYQLMEDAQRNPGYPSFAQPALIFHGKNDAVVPPEYSVTFAQGNRNAALYLMESGHELSDVMNDMWMEAEAFLFAWSAAKSTRFAVRPEAITDNSDGLDQRKRLPVLIEGVIDYG